MDPGVRLTTQPLAHLLEIRARVLRFKAAGAGARPFIHLTTMYAAHGTRCPASHWRGHREQQNGHWPDSWAYRLVCESPRPSCVWSQTYKDPKMYRFKDGSLNCSWVHTGPHNGTKENLLYFLELYFQSLRLSGHTDNSQDLVRGSWQKNSSIQPARYPLFPPQPPGTHRPASPPG